MLKTDKSKQIKKCRVSTIISDKINMKSAKYYYQALLLFSTIACTSNQILSAQNFTPIKVGDKWGFADSTGKVIIDAQYLEVKNFLDEITGVKISLATWILIDKTGKKVNDNTYENVEEFHNELAIVNPKIKGDYNKYYAIIDNTGKQVTEMNYQYLSRFSEGMAVVRQNNKYGFLDTNMKIVIPLNYDNAKAFKEGLAAVNLGGTGQYPWDITGGKWGFINKTGELVIPHLYDWCSEFEDGETNVEIKKKNFKINKAGEKIK